MTFTNTKQSLLILAVLSLIACGASEEATVNETAPTEKAEVAKFKGHKYAPPQDIMNREAAKELWDRKGSAKILPGEACKRVMRMSQMTPECQVEYDNLLATSVFTPRECRKGDERTGYNNTLIDPVSCDGKIDTPAGSGNVLMVFHKEGDEWKAWYGYMVSGSWVSR